MIPTKVRKTVMDREQGRCARCGQYVMDGPHSIHHRRPRGMGGSSDPLTEHPANLVLLCGSGTTGCHGWIERHRAEALETGWLLRQGVDPRTAGLVRRGLGGQSFWHTVTADAIRVGCSHEGIQAVTAIPQQRSGEQVDNYHAAMQTARDELGAEAVK